MRLGVIGAGFVGNSVIQIFSETHDLFVYDTNSSLATHSLGEVLDRSEFIFICVPTPMARDGSVDSSIVESILQEANDSVAGGFIIKSTLPPLELRRLNEIYGSLIFSPEFLREKTALDDAFNPERLIFGGDYYTRLVHQEKIAQLHYARFPEVPQVWTSLEGAALVKYYSNVFLAEKVAIFNEFYQVAEALGEDFATLRHTLLLDNRIGSSHTSVPGHDGYFGFGGSCFHKDVSGYRSFVRDLGVAPTLADAAWKKNFETRGEETIRVELNSLKGRAVVEDVEEEINEQ